MQFNRVNNTEMLVFPFIGVHGEAVAQPSAVSGALAQVHVGYAVSV